MLEEREVVFYGDDARFMSRFHVRDAFPMNDKSIFVMAGFVIEGDIAAGMLVRLPFRDTVMMTAGIDQIQHLRRPDGDVVCLCIRCADPKEVALWEALKIRDKTVEIIKAEALL